MRWIERFDKYSRCTLLASVVCDGKVSVPEGWRRWGAVHLGVGRDISRSRLLIQSQIAQADDETEFDAVLERHSSSTVAQLAHVVIHCRVVDEWQEAKCIFKACAKPAIKGYMHLS